MFESLTDKLDVTFQRLRGRGKLSEKNIQEALKEVRTSLLEADVNFKVVKRFIRDVKSRAVGEEVMRSLSPGQMFVKVVHEELNRLMGEAAVGLNLASKPPVGIMVVGLQGSGKTTTIAKLARLLREEHRRRCILVPADVYRPAAIEQLKVLGDELGVSVYPSTSEMDPVEICKNAMHTAEISGSHDTVLMDTAGRLHVDRELMDELTRIKAAVSPAEILLVADSMSGQDAVNVAKEFDERLDIDGVILTKLDGDARGGAALSIRAVTGKPIKYVGVGETLDAIEEFHPDRMASRILGMGDMLTLIEKAEKVIDEEKAEELERKMRKNEFSLEDFLETLRQVKKLGSLGGILEKLPIPGLSKEMRNAKNMATAEKQLKKTEAIICSMTKAERRNHAILNGSRRKRIASGSGTTVQDVNQLLKQYLQMRKMMKKMSSGKGLPFGLGM